MSEKKSWSRKAGHNVRSLVHQRSASGLGGNDISSDVTKVVRGQYKSSDRIIITCLHLPHWKASVSACWSAAPSDMNKLSSSIFASAALRSSEAISCKVSLSNSFSKNSLRASKTNLAGHFGKRLGGDISGRHASPKARVVLVFEVDEQHPYLRLVRRCCPLAVLVCGFLYRARTLQYEVGRWGSGERHVTVRKGSGRGNNKRRHARKPDSSARASYSISMHLSRVLSPVIDVLTPSLFAVRAPLFEAPGVEAETDAIEALRGGGASVRGGPPNR